MPTAPAAVNRAPDMDTQNAADEPSPAPIGRSDVTTAFPGLYLHKNTANHIFTSVKYNVKAGVKAARLIRSKKKKTNPKIEV